MEQYASQGFLHLTGESYLALKESRCQSEGEIIFTEGQVLRVPIKNIGE